ncbi:MAG: hypothetical protein ABI969_12225, partial [bacterium]
ATHPPDAYSVTTNSTERDRGSIAIPPSLDVERGDISIRPIRSLPEFLACVDLQADVWGPDYSDNVPASLLQVATYVGGVVTGAFDGAGELAGFVFGITGVEDGEIIHWSHLLGVRDSARNLGVGRLLKEAQRAELAERGVRTMRWTFDPLVAKNAHLNLNRLGARVVEYVCDMYGTTRSPLHYGLATDRLVVSCSTHPEAVAPTFAPPTSPCPVATAEPHAGDMLLDSSSPPSVFGIEVPSDVQQVIARSPGAAAHWRESVRKYFQWGLARGYEVTGIQRDPVTSRSFYILEQPEGA